MCETSEDVLTRLDTLLTQSGPDSVNSNDSNISSTSSTPSSILKTSPNSSAKKKSLKFRDELQEVIGYGGEECSSDSDSEISAEISNKESETNDELTVEEKNVLNLTRQNTTFNAHAQNLNSEASNTPLLRLGVDKKVTPIITVS